MRKWLVLGAVVAQVAVLAYMMGSRELILATGKTIVVRTAPIDPRDPFRGDFVRLSYAFNQANLSAVTGKPGPVIHSPRGLRVYAVMREAPGGIHRFDHLSRDKPANGVFLKGKTLDRFSSRRGANARIRYGVEQLFVEQGQGKVIENRRGTRNSMQVPMEVTLAVSADGTALIKDYDWSALGIQTEMQVAVTRRRPGANRNNRSQATPPVNQEERLSPVIKVTLQNASNKPLAISNPGNDCGFQLINEPNGRNAFQVSNPPCDETSNADSTPIILRPGDKYAREFDLAKPRWHVTVTKKDGATQTGEIGVVAARVTFRFVYRTESEENARGIRWVGELPGRAFRGSRLID